MKLKIYGHKAMLVNGIKCLQFIATVYTVYVFLIKLCGMIYCHSDITESHSLALIKGVSIFETMLSPQ